MRILLSLMFVFSFSTLSYAADDMRLYRLDCGAVQVVDLNIFSTDNLYEGQKKNFVSSCYIIKHGEHVLLWDAGLPASLIDTPDTDSSDGFLLSVTKTISSQLKDIGLTPVDVTHVALSHGHGDHSGNLSLFKNATLLIQKPEYKMIKDTPEKAKEAHLAVGNFDYFVQNPDKVKVVDGDFDVFGDQRIHLISLPGHTIGHMGLMVDLPKAGKVILSGDQWHFSENRINDGVPTFNYDVKSRGNGMQTRASSAKLEKFVKKNDALLIIQHEPKHVHRLPAFPDYLD